MSELLKDAGALIEAYMDFLESISTPERNFNYEFNEYLKVRGLHRKASE